MNMRVINTKEDYLSFFNSNNIYSREDFYNYLIKISNGKLNKNDLESKKILQIKRTNSIDKKYLNIKYLKNKDFDAEEDVRIEDIFNLDAIKNKSDYYTLGELLDNLLEIYYNIEKFNGRDFHNKWSLKCDKIIDQFLQYDSNQKVYNSNGVIISYENNNLFITDGRHRCTCSLILNAQYIKVFNPIEYYKY